MTFLANLSLVPQHTCWKCPADLLSIAIEGIEAFRQHGHGHNKRTRDDRMKRKSRKKQRKQVLKDKAAELKVRLSTQPLMDLIWNDSSCFVCVCVCVCV